MVRGVPASLPGVVAAVTSLVRGFQVPGFHPIE